MLTIVLTAGLLVALPTSSAMADPGSSTCYSGDYDTDPSSTGTLGPAAPGDPITTSQITARAADWINDAVPYSQTCGWSDPATGGGYRQDCSGYVAMAWGLARGDVVTGTLPHYAQELTGDISGYTGFQPGDALDYTADHVVLFDSWISQSDGTFNYDAEHTSGQVADQTEGDIYSSTLEGYSIDDYEGLRYDNLTVPASVVPSGTHQASEAVAQNSGTVDLLYKGTDGTLQHAWYNPGSTWNPAMSLGGAMASEPSTVTSNAGHVEAFWQGTDGTLWHAYTNGGDWTAPVSLGYALGGAPRAVAQANGDLDAFWVGADGGLWYAQYTVGGNWPATATELAPAGSVATGTLPAPVVSAAGTTDVFYKGTDNSLYHVWSNDYGASWNSPVDLGMGPLGSGPAATGHVNGDVDVFWVGADAGIWSAQYTVGGTWPSVPSELAPAGSAAAGVLPAPVTSADPTTDVFYQGADGTLYHVWSNNYGSTWNAPQRLGTGTITQPFVAGQSNGTIDVFWKDPSGANIWHTWYQPANGWTGNPADMGGNAA